MNTNKQGNTKHLTSQHLAKRWSISIQTLYNWVSTGGDLPPSIKIGGKRRWILEDVESYEADIKEQTSVRVVR